jgi:selenocysteine-specific elongation factor
MKAVVVGTAGHIDHGKSALVEALTGTHPDRLEEEKRRGITIDLGFAFLALPDVHLAFVDVPGHERFVRNMVAGATGTDLVLLVVAADESIKPQTREHFDICRLLGISRGVVALTKADLVDAETLELVRTEVQEFVQGSFLEGAPIIATSVRTGQGLEDLKAILREMALTAPARDSQHYARLPIDRAFTIRGFGTVVTGTLVAGTIRPGDELEIFPGRLRVRVRGVQSAGQSASEVRAGQRAALNLAGVEVQQVRRGMVLATPGRFRTAQEVDARVHLLPEARPLRDRTPVHLHLGTAETVAEVLLLNVEKLLPGQSALARFRLRQPLVALPGDRFILRQFSPVTTIAGGVVVDLPEERSRLRDPARLALLARLEQGSASDRLGILIETSSTGISMAEAIARTGLRDVEIRGLGEELERQGRCLIVSQDPWVAVAPQVLDQCLARLQQALEDFHRARPLAFGMHKEELRDRAARRFHSAVFEAALARAAAQGLIETRGDQVARAGREIRLTPEEQQARAQLEKLLEQAGFAVPRLSEVLPRLPVDASRGMHLVQWLIRQGTLVRISEELVLHRSAITRLRALLADYRRRRGERISVPAFKELIGLTRKHAIPLLEYLDREKITRRVGDERIIL